LLSPTTAEERPILHLYAHHEPPSKLNSATHKSPSRLAATTSIVSKREYMDFKNK
jgi:hypothetical protein